MRDVILAYNLNLDVPIPLEWASGASQKEVLDRLLNMEELTVSARSIAGDKNGPGWTQSPFPSTNLFELDGPGTAAFLHVVAQQEKNDILATQLAPGQNDSFAASIAPRLEQSIYFFDAQRVPRNQYAFGSSTQLNSNADNLAEVLNVLQANRTAFAEYVDAVARVIPAVKWISVTPSSVHGNQVEVRIWNVPDSTKRDDLAIPLAECGTGVGQILSILYVVMRSSGNVIVIDEPNSFLHPRAAKSLMGILKEDRSNQYIISTHSPEILASSEPDRFYSLKFAKEKTVVTEVTRSDFASIKQVLSELGAQLSDVFGADNVLWVEGPTEVQCFPLLLAAGGRVPGSGLTFAPLRNTGDLESRHGAIVADIYRNLSSAHSILPTTVAVSLDGDQRSIKDQENLERAFGSVLHFLDRRCYENYLIHPVAICSVLNATETFGGVLTASQVHEWILENGKDERLKAQEYEVLSPEWLARVDAPRLLEQLFQDISGAKEIYRKPLHSVALTKWLVEHDHRFLDELINYVVGLVPKLDA
ncbi:MULTISPECIES: AAA family ATPase [unclassified Bradyrhizobium]|uniref:AAA family ATPase n=1 Tax=unclassified Bradyrhizobium TaxID=2631580 RepID=UPI00048B7974|nr:MULTISPECIES: AAA family ATPase [unclassified Bradyrhizobium]